MGDQPLDALQAPEEPLVAEATEGPVVRPPVVEPAPQTITLLMGYDADGAMITAVATVSSLSSIANEQGHPLREVKTPHGLTYIHVADLADGTWVYAPEDAGSR